MGKQIIGAVCAGVLSLGLLSTADAALEPRLGGEAYYDTVLGITWAADANSNGLATWADQMTWVSGVEIGGIDGWRLPGLSPIDGISFDMTRSNNATTDVGTADSVGWVDGVGIPVSEMGHLYYVTLGNLGAWIPNGGGLSTTTTGQPGSGLTNPGPFDLLSIQEENYWSGMVSTDPNFAWRFHFGVGYQGVMNNNNQAAAWAVRDGDVGAGAVPLPGTVLLLGGGLAGLLGFGKKRRV